MTNALVYHEFFRHSDKVGLAVARGGMGLMATEVYGDPVGPRMVRLVMKALHDHFAGALPVAVTGNPPQHAIKGTVGVDSSARPSGSPTYPLDVFAALSADRKKLAISVVKPTETAQECELNLSGVQPSGDARLWQLTAPAGAAAVPAGRGGFGFGPPAGQAGDCIGYVQAAISRKTLRLRTPLPFNTSRVISYAAASSQYLQYNTFCSDRLFWAAPVVRWH